MNSGAAPSESPEIPPLSEETQRRGRWLAIGSHPFSMVFRVAHLRDLATQALVTLGAAEVVVGLHASLAPFATILQLPSLRIMDRLGKRRLLLYTQLVALAAAWPLVIFEELRELGSGVSTPLALISLAITTAALTVGSTAWWPMLHGFVRLGRTSRFFAALRTVWHIALIGFFLFSTWWLAVNPGAFGLLFGVAWACGAVRAVLLHWFPERSEPTQLQLRETLGMMWGQAPLRRYLIGVTLDNVVLRSVPPFMILMLRKEVGLGEAETMVLTLAFFVGGLLALYPAGRVADKVGARPVLLLTCLLRGGLIAGMGWAAFLPGEQLVLWVVTGLYFGFSLLSAGFGVAEIKVLFQLAPTASPSSVIVVAVVVRNVVAALAPILVGATLKLLQEGGAEPLSLYLGFFIIAGTLQIVALVPFLQTQAAESGTKG